MSVPDKKVVIQTLSQKFKCHFKAIKRKQIMFEGINNGKKIIICTPSSKIHAQGNGWFDLNTKQVAILDEAEFAVLAVRLEGKKIYYVDFKELKRLMTPEVICENYAEGKHWKLFVWETYIQIQGNDQKFNVQPQIVTVDYNVIN
ncbi:hypothetical protein AKL49_25165 [Salmonella enterica]|nr:hypothetical protein [Salmonella enterica]